ncbi:MAG TPA: hypothetical protein VFJ18_09745 [Pararhizobium sp.]|nr:hypothetical protein [Pararhizobium sp.]
MPGISSRIGLASLIFAGMLAVPLSTAQAQGFDLRIGPNGITPEFHDRHDRRRHERDHRRDRCDLDEARHIARRYGLHRAEIARVTRHSVVVEGYSHGDRERMRFANEDGCPVIR